MSKFEQLKQQLQVIAKLGSALGLLSWDEEVNLPPKGHAYRAEVNGFLAGELHRRMTEKNFTDLVDELAKSNRLKPAEQIMVRETKRDVDKARKVPTEFVQKLSILTSQAFERWAVARQQADFRLFAPILKKIVAMKRQEAEYLGYQNSPYDALLDQYEPEMTTAQVEGLFKPLAQALAELVPQVRGVAQPRLPKANYELEAQQQLASVVAKALGYDLEAGRIDASAHPFTTSFHPTDVRITTRYSTGDFWVTLGSTIHEVGHALYEQGLPAKHFATPLGEAASLGIHESQSRTWENLVGRSEAFCRYLYPLLVKYFGKSSIRFSWQELHHWLNRVKPNLIRVESDEVTYNLHIILRFEIEKDLIENRIQVSDLPAAWNEKIKNYLGLKVPDDAQGVLQDVHWAHGFFGYFPTYTLGNLYAAQLFATAKQKLPKLEQEFAKGEFQPLLSWLRRNIHVHGRRYQPAELVQKATGQPLDSRYLLSHLKTKVDLLRG